MLGFYDLPEPRWAPKVSGVYVIRCLENGKTYVGYTTNYYKRMRDHFFSLKQNRHYAEEMQNDWNRGYDFVYGLAMECSGDELLGNECRLIWELKSYKKECGYNFPNEGGERKEIEKVEYTRNTTKDYGCISSYSFNKCGKRLSPRLSPRKDKRIRSLTGGYATSTPSRTTIVGFMDY